MADHENKLRDLITMFPFHVEGDTCAPSYAPYFTAAAELVGEACATFVPQ
jgi:Zn-finger protein